MTTILGNLVSHYKNTFRSVQQSFLLLVLTQLIFTLIEFPFQLLIENTVLSFFGVIFVQAFLILGLCSVYLSAAQRKKQKSHHLFSFVPYVFKTFVFLVVFYALIFLGLLCFIFPGIYVYLYCSQSLFILTEDPHKPLMDVIQESGRMMRKNYGEFLLLQVPLIPVYILPILVFSVEFNRFDNFISFLILPIVLFSGVLTAHFYLSKKNEKQNKNLEHFKEG